MVFKEISFWVFIEARVFTGLFKIPPSHAEEESQKLRLSPDNTQGALRLDLGLSVGMCDGTYGYFGLPSNP